MLLGWGLLPDALAQTTSASTSSTDARPAAQARVLKDVVISGSRTERDPDELPMSIDVLNAADLEAAQMQDMRDVGSQSPGVTVPRAPARFAIGSQTGRDQNSGFSIRGLDGNRVLILVDGIRQPRSYAFPSESAIGRDYIDLSLVKRVEIVRGATSALYGSDGVAGLVNFITKDPQDYLQDGKTVGGSASLGYSGDSEAWRLGATVAGRASERLDWLLSVGTSKSGALKNMGTNDAANTDRTTPNPESDTGRSLLGKLVFNPGGGQRHVLTFEHVEKSAAYDLLSNIAKPPLAATSTLGSSGTTDMRRDRLTWDGRWQIDRAWADDLRAVVSYQRSDSNEYFFQDRNTAADRSRDTDYAERTLQANLQASRLLRMGSDWGQRLVYGFEHVRSDITNLQTGITPPAGETYPLKRFPDTTESSSALYVQDEFILGDWSVTPGVRFDHFSIDASPVGYSAPSTARSMSGSATSPKLGVLYRLTPQWSIYGNYASGFKAPTAGQVNGYFANPLANYQSIANPDLRPEKSRNIELGAKARLDQVTLDLAAFTGRYKDFIQEFTQVGGSFTAADPAIYQSVNIGNVRISGVELKGRVDWGKVGAGRLSSPFAYARTRGRDADSNAPLNSVVPQRVTAGVSYDLPDWTATLTVNHYAAKPRSEINGATQFATPAATVVDVSGQWRVRKDLRLTAGLYNLTDRKYWRWSDVIGQSSTSTTLDAYTQPGRYARVTLVKDF